MEHCVVDRGEEELGMKEECGVRFVGWRHWDGEMGVEALGSDWEHRWD